MNGLTFTITTEVADRRSGGRLLGNWIAKDIYAAKIGDGRIVYDPIL